MRRLVHCAPGRPAAAAASASSSVAPAYPDAKNHAPAQSTAIATIAMLRPMSTLRMISSAAARLAGINPYRLSEEPATPHPVIPDRVRQRRIA